MREEREDTVGPWIRLAGRRPAPDPTRARHIRAAVRGEWARAVRRERNATRLRRFGVVVAAAAAVVVVAVAVRFGLFRPGPVVLPAPAGPRVAAVQGTVGAAQADHPVAAAPILAGDRIDWGSAVETAADGRVALALPHGPSIRLDASTRAVPIGPQEVVLERGAIYVDTGAEGNVPFPALSVRTPRGLVRDVGTRFEVRLDVADDAVTVLVRDGSVELIETVASGAGRRRLVPRETAVRWGADGFSEASPVGPADEVWGWTLNIAPNPQIDGKPVRSFLDWAAREGGWRLQFADVETARAAQTVTLGGSIDGLSVMAALDAVLPTCGMEHRIRDGVLSVRRGPDS